MARRAAHARVPDEGAEPSSRRARRGFIIGAALLLSGLLAVAAQCAASGSGSSSAAPRDSLLPARPTGPATTAPGTPAVPVPTSDPAPEPGTGTDSGTAGTPFRERRTPPPTATPVP